ncbi:atypical chemokine receptor 3-like [Stegastes partitus]|uniref:Atypical chemokine receptor 3-like n=1 Tax=Stegastes partitus TaxID=144197 RepID=A0A9Y4KD52_9TELE|nr:PREDICTED: atypical chemokine receptor 3-like [Stegastes partitus]
MSLNAADLSELLELWAELNLTELNVSRVEALRCSGSPALLPALSVLYAAIFLLGVAANALVLWAERRRCETRLYVVNLAAADLVVVATLPLWVTSLLRGGRWPFGFAVCKLAHLLFGVSLFASIFFLACIAADRLLSLRAAAGRGRKLQRRLVCLLVWSAALAASAPDTFFLQLVKSTQHDGAVCRPVYPSDSPRRWTAGVQLSFFVLGFALPFPVMAVCYLQVAAAPPGSDRQRRVALGYVVAFAACWLPFHAVLLLDSLALLGALSFSCRLENFLDAALRLTQCCSLLHCCVNPVLYGSLGRTFLDHVNQSVQF